MPPKKQKSPAARAAAAKRQRKPASSPKMWSGRVTKESNALDLSRGVFTLRSPERIAQSLKRSAERSKRRKAGAYQSAMSMLNFYINRGGKNLSASRRKILARAKVELRRAFGRPTDSGRRQAMRALKA